MEEPLEIALATYNGALYIGEFLKSLANQTYPNWRLIARDDNSSDGTLAILKEFQQSYPDRVTLIQDRLGNLGVRENFNQVLMRSQAKYVMLADQDDVWLPSKAEHTLLLMYDLVARYGPKVPLLVHSDAKVVDSSGNQLAPSLWQYQYLDPRTGSYLNRLLVQNVVTGCTVMVNRELLLRALPIPPEAIVHDWWLALVAAALGRLAYLREATVLYRQHESNSIGAKRWGYRHVLNKLGQGISGLRRDVFRSQQQASALLRRCQAELDWRRQRQLAVFSQLSNMNGLSRRFLAAKYGFYKVGMLRNMGFYIVM